MGADPTLEFLARLDDPALYDRKENVPAFVAHKRKFKGRDGKTQEIEVTESDLQKIADNANKREKETGTLAVIKIGHVRPDEDEESQPDIIGFARDWHVGTFGPDNKPALLYTEIIEKGRRGERREYPFRSPEYYPNKKQITGVAILKRDPELDLGMVAYDKTATAALRDGGLLCYSAEVNTMPDPTMPPDPDVTSAAPAPDPEAGEMAEYMKHCMSHPYAAKALAKYGAAATPAPAAGPMNTAMPGGGDDNPATPYQGQDAEMVAYAKRLEARLAKAEKRASHAEQVNLALQYQRELADLASEAGMDEDKATEFVARETARVQLYSRAQFDAHKAVLTDTIGDLRDPTRGPMLSVANTTPKKTKREFGERELDQVLTYMRSGMDEHAAYEKVMAN